MVGKQVRVMIGNVPLPLLGKLYFALQIRTRESSHIQPQRPIQASELYHNIAKPLEQFLHGISSLSIEFSQEFSHVARNASTIF